MRRVRDERGAAAIFLVMLAVVLMGVAGLIVDGGLAINARMRVADDAEQAARAGARAVDIAVLRSEQRIVLNQTDAAGQAAAHLRAIGYTAGQYGVSTDGNGVTVWVRDRVYTTTLSLIGIQSFPVRAQATSIADTGP